MSASIEDIIAEAKVLFGKWKLQKFDTVEQELEFRKKMRVEHKNFMDTYYVVLDGMITKRLFNVRLLKRYFMKISKLEPYDSEGKIEADASYLTWLYMLQHPHISKAEQLNHKKMIMDAHYAERERMKEAKEKAEKEWEAEQAILRAQRVESLRKYITALADAQNTKTTL